MGEGGRGMRYGRSSSGGGRAEGGGGVGWVLGCAVVGDGGRCSASMRCVGWPGGWGVLISEEGGGGGNVVDMPGGGGGGELPTLLLVGGGGGMSDRWRKKSRPITCTGEHRCHWSGQLMVLGGCTDLLVTSGKSAGQ